MEDQKIFDFTVIYNNHKVRLYHYVLKITRSRMTAEDIVHNVFVKFYDNMETVTGTEKTERWLFSVARNEAMGYFRSQKIRNAEDIDLNAGLHDDETPEGEYEKSEIRGLMEMELNGMPTEQSEVFRLKEISGMSYREVAAVLKITEDLVRSRLYKARQKLKTAIMKLIS